MTNEATPPEKWPSLTPVHRHKWVFEHQGDTWWHYKCGKLGCRQEWTSTRKLHAEDGRNQEGVAE